MTGPGTGFVVRSGTDDHRSCTIPEENTACTVFPVYYTAVYLRPDYKHVPCRPGGNVGARRLQAVDEPGARCYQIHRSRVARSQFVLHDTRRRGETGIIGSAGCQEDKVDLIRGNPCVIKRPVPRVDRKIAGGLVIRSDVTVPDASMGIDPFIGGIHYCFQLAIVHAPLRHVRTQAG